MGSREGAGRIGRMKGSHEPDDEEANRGRDNRGLKRFYLDGLLFLIFN